MSCLVWNCQGLGGPWTIRHLRDLVRKHNPLLVFLIETKCNAKKLESVKRPLEMYGVNVNSKGKSGGLGLLWSKEVFVDLMSFSPNHIDARVRLDDNEDYWRFTGFYGAPDVRDRHQSSNLLRHLSSISSLSWLCARDFNAIMTNTKKDGKLDTPQWQLRDFREALTDSRLIDIGFTGDPFTWVNNREYPNTVRKRLDRVCGNSQWITSWPNTQVSHLERIYSDHAPLLVKRAIEKTKWHTRSSRFIRFEAQWIESTKCEEVLSKLWHGSSDFDPNGDLM
ncbi:UNVERIFIED_CONTAM: hypothetical protein Slati_4249500 [Sesamum latifolium]|uniref:Endonuclease/exonuclease/phosphatase domain-containing protein n=1 Tax=Sesamum latifolium TaxID=2727402 RepID=A0AAW2TF88_9LAMI